MIRIYVNRLIIFLGIILFFNACSGQPSPENPNILIILTDQWRAQSFGYMGNPDVQTPNIDQLAEESANFQFAVSGLPVCTPYRASLLTGQRPLTNGVFMNDVQLDTNAVTIAEVLDDQGYQTGYIGKWHLDGRGRSNFTPPGGRRQGFQYWKALETTHTYNHSAYYFGEDSTKRFWKGYDAFAQGYDAQSYIRVHADDEQPFFLMLSWGQPHSPYHTAPQRYKDIYHPDSLWLRPNVPDKIENKVRRDLTGYYAHMTALDDMVGSIRQTLEDEGIAENTIVLFTSDHGDLLGSHGEYKKQQPYDESIRIPMLFHYGAEEGIENDTYDAMMNAQDVMPTLLGLSGVGIPESVEGADFSRYMRGGESPKDTLALIMCIQAYGQWDPVNDGGKEYRGIRTPRYTYTRDLDGPWQLFDNSEEPYQMNNLVGNSSYAEIQKRLDNALMNKLDEIGDEFLPGLDYVERYNYPELDASQTVPYEW